MKKISLLILGLVLVGAGCTGSVYEASDMALNVETAVIGDTILGMEVVSIEPFVAGEAVGPLNAVVQFSGEVELTGVITEGSRSDLTCMRPDETSMAKLPVIEGSTIEKDWLLCFSGNRADVRAYGMELGDQVTVVVDQYAVSSYTEELIDFAFITEVK